MATWKSGKPRQTTVPYIKLLDYEPSAVDRPLGFPSLRHNCGALDFPRILVMNWKPLLCCLFFSAKIIFNSSSLIYFFNIFLYYIFLFFYFYFNNIIIYLLLLVVVVVAFVFSYFFYYFNFIIIYLFCCQRDWLSKVAIFYRAIAPIQERASGDLTADIFPSKISAFRLSKPRCPRSRRHRLVQATKTNQLL